MNVDILIQQLSVYYIAQLKPVVKLPDIGPVITNNPGIIQSLQESEISN